jgi:hypothetical protein
MARSRKGGRKKQDGPREANGRLQRGILDQGTDELRVRKLAVTGSDRLELTPLGILMGRGLITVEQFDAAAKFRALHLSVFRDAPRAPLPMMAKLPSDPSQWDEPIVRSAESDEDKRDRWHRIHDNLTLPQWELVQALVIHEEFSGVSVSLFTELVARNISGFAMLDPHERRASRETVMRVQAIRNTLDRLQPPARVRWTELSESQRNAMQAPL